MYSGFNILCLIVTVSQTSCSMGHILYLIPVWALATAWLYLLTRLAPSLDVEHEVSEMVIVVELKLQKHSLKSQNFVCDNVCNFFFNIVCHIPHKSFVVNRYTHYYRYILFYSSFHCDKVFNISQKKKTTNHIY